MFNLKLSARQFAGLLALSSLFLITACSEKQQAKPQGMQIPVSVIQVQPASIEVAVNLPGRVEAIKDAEIRARVTGIVNEISFKQGSNVQEGQMLFQIDPAPYKAVRDQASAKLQGALADVKVAEALAARYDKLVKSNAVSRQDYDNAIAQAGQARAAVAAAQASLQAAEIDLGYTAVTSPIDGRIGKSFVTEGALVSATQATLLAAVQQLDNVYIDITRSTAELAQLRQALESGELKQNADGHAQVNVILEDGSTYKHTGKLLFSGVSVNPATSQVNLRAEVPNPEQILLPGMYVRVQLQQGTDENALLVPDQAIQRGADGLNTLMLVVDGKVQPIAVNVGAKANGQTVITKGLSAGDTVIVEGFQKIRPGAPVKGLPWGESESKNTEEPNASEQQSEQ